ncbi:oxidoreductase FAD/NAD(P)-binding [Shewanella denitrificans OS217]|jgi:ferredoxin/flavodoxin---NADP+ reductase|uniref:ferredoxin--NADP(+) reductase n=1 Tax=Shewanella denitrificans (strain OS217 / ATCC BAA-1090 / DSM 15013) TaxID=318161 RepID=Q12K52_SHEDO|nr:ferredoxin--NADP reductase [Shewanella denitrificans]ABE56174.1 oxidoreductase FAD/NAD(P)-binding [Shewanella denitrificans OS217]
MWTQGLVVARRDWNDKLFTLSIKAEIAPFIAGQFIKLSQVLADKRVARAYSIVSAPDAELLEVLAIKVEAGQLSPALHQLAIGDAITVSTKAAGFLTLDELPQSADYSNLWFLATGTGVGPFISMLRTQAPWLKYEKIILVYGVSYQTDIAYHDVIQQLLLQYPKQFVFIPMVTRDPEASVSMANALHCRIPQGLVSGELETRAQVDINPQSSQVMICGNPEMISEVQTLLLERGLSKNLRRAPGQITLEKYW